MKKEIKKLVLKRHDLSEDKSLKAFSAADELILERFEQVKNQETELSIYNDRFGFLTCNLTALEPTTIISNKSQKNAIVLNCQANGLSFENYDNPLSRTTVKSNFALLKVPKSLALFELYLYHICQNSTSDVQVIAGFMTRHFSPKMIEIAEKYFEQVEQSRAVKKARTVTFSNKKTVTETSLIDTLEYNGITLKQYWGVFSAKHIDYATQYFLEHLQLQKTDSFILELASGNGVIAREILAQLPTAALHLLDDSFLAVESAKLNVRGNNVHHHLENNLSKFEDECFDLIATNPPFHFEHEINVQIPIQLFRECHRCLKRGGNLQLVANNHLNYSSQLKKIFRKVETVAQNENFSVLKCGK